MMELFHRMDFHDSEVVLKMSDAAMVEGFGGGLTRDEQVALDLRRGDLFAYASPSAAAKQAAATRADQAAVAAASSSLRLVPRSACMMSALSSSSASEARMSFIC